uniref:Uncharacterized protein n=1 Tax=Avena sativa TaxID=4498 RepID=A0ACD5XY80_AVESA
MPPRESNNEAVTPAADANAVAAAFLPRDVIASILIRLPASVLRRLRIVCKEWRDVISDPIFIRAQTLQGSHAPTHTIVFAHSSSRSTGGIVFLFDEGWRLTARFTVDVSEDMVGTSNGLLCFHDRREKIIRIVQPFTGEAITVPEPLPEAPTDGWSSLCFEFGFDATTRQYKIVSRHVAYDPQDRRRCTVLVNLFTVGVDKDWRIMSTDAYFSSSLRFFSDMACNGTGAVYWTYKQRYDMIPTYTRLDPATEEITSVECRIVDKQPVFCHHPSWKNPGMIGIRWLSDDGCWPPDMTSMAHQVDAVKTLPRGMVLPSQHALQRGHLMLLKRNGTLYAYKIS